MAEIRTPARRLTDLNPEWLPTAEVLAERGGTPRSALECACGRWKGESDQ